MEASLLSEWRFMQKPNFGLLFLPQHITRCRMGEAAATRTLLHFSDDISKTSLKSLFMAVFLFNT